MTPTEEFFDRLGRAGHEPRLANAKGTVRFDLSETDPDAGEQVLHWHVAVLHGDVAVSRDDAASDWAVQTSRELFDRIVTGEVNVMAAVLRGAVRYEGDPKFAVLFRRLFGQPEPAGAAGSGPGA